MKSFNDLLNLQTVTVPYINELYAAKPWLDIPVSKILPDQPQLQALKKMMDDYHGINKSDKLRLLERAFMLEQIQGLVERTALIFNEPTLQKALINLGIAAKSKKSYLERVAEYELRQGQWRCYLVGGNTEHGELRTLRKQQRGEKDAVDFDPCSRHLYETGENTFSQLFDKWNQLALHDENSPDFYLWLETQDEQTQSIEPDINMQFIRLLGLQECVIKVGKIYLKKNGDLIENYQGDYTISSKGELYIALGWYQGLVGATRHPNIISPEQPVLCGGYTKIIDGKIESLSNWTGHFEATPSNLKNAVKLLNKKGVLKEDAQISVFLQGSSMKEFTLVSYMKEVVNTPNLAKAQKEMKITDISSPKISDFMKANIYLWKRRAIMKEASKDSMEVVTPMQQKVEVSAPKPEMNVEPKAKKSKPLIYTDRHKIQFTKPDQQHLPDELIKRMAENDPTLEHLALQACGIAAWHMNAISKALVNNTHLLSLDISNNGLVDLPEFIEALESNHSLQFINIECGSLSKEYVDKIASICEEKGIELKATIRSTKSF